MLHVFIAVLIANQEVKVFESTETYPTEQVCKTHIPEFMKRMKVIAKNVNAEAKRHHAKADVKVVAGVCAPEPKPKGEESL